MTHGSLVLVLVGDIIEGVGVEREYLARSRCGDGWQTTCPCRSSAPQCAALLLSSRTLDVQAILQLAGEGFLIADAVAHDHAGADECQPAHTGRLLARDAFPVAHAEAIDA